MESDETFRRSIGRPLGAARTGAASGCTHVMHGRRDMTIEGPSHTYNAGTEHVGFSLARQTLLAPSAKRREVLG